MRTALNRPDPHDDLVAITRSIRWHLVGAVCALALLAGGAGVLAAGTEFTGAVVAPGTLVVDSNIKKVQHPTGGIVGEIRVADGDHVNAGDLLIRLDETITHANLLVITKQLDEISIRQARLNAEIDSSDHMDVPASFAARSTDPQITAIVKSERTLFESRRTARAGQKAQLNQRASQLRDEIVGLSGQQSATANQLALIQNELKGVQELYAKRLVPITRVTALRREASRLDGERAQLIASLAQAKGKIAETELQTIQVDHDFRTDVVKELRELQGKEAELLERKIAAEDQLKRIEIRSPQAGIVHQLSVHTIGGVISPGEPVMMIVPDDETLVIEAKISPQDIDQIHAGQKAALRLTAFNQRTTPEIDGVMLRVSPDLTTDQRTGVGYYTARISVPADQTDKLGLHLVPGMPVEVFVQTGSRTVLSYFVKPLADQVAKAFRER